MQAVISNIFRFPVRLLAWLLVATLPLAGCGANHLRESGTPCPAMREAEAPAPTERLPSIIPKPLDIRLSAGRFAVADGTKLLCAAGDNGCVWIANYVAGLVKRTRGLSLVPATGSTSGELRGAIVLRRLGDPSATGREGYRLDVTPDGIIVSAGTRTGLFYGGITLWQLLTQDSAPIHRIALPAMRITDAPRFAWRGFLLDSVRHFQTPAFVKSFIDAMALHKLNVLQSHLSDDQGWRLQIKRYPRLTAVGAWRIPAGAAAAADIDPSTGKPRLYGGFYTQVEVRDIVAYAKKRNITIVPEIEMPGHALAAIVAYPRLGSIRNPPKSVSSDWGVFPYLYNVDNSTFTFLENVLTETMRLFPSRYIDVGGDEAVKDQWKASPKIQAQMHRLGIANEDGLQSYFIRRIGRFLAAHGRKLIGWDEILQGGAGPGATITSWRGVVGAIAAAKSGHDAVLSPAPTLYFDNRQAEGANEPPGRGAIVSLKDVYDFDSTPASLTAEQRSHIIGLQANIWTEHIRKQELVDYAAFPRAAALAELAWSPAAAHDWKNFLFRVPAELRRYRALGITHSESAFAIHVSARKSANGAVAALSNQANFGEIRYTLDGSHPPADSSLYRAPLDVHVPTRIDADAFAGGQALTAPTSVAIDEKSLLRRDSHEMTLCSNRVTLSLEDDAPLHGPRARFLVDIENPCWIYRKADLSGVASIEVAVGQLPFNFQIGDDKRKIALPPPQTPDGELDVHLDSCAGQNIAVLSLAPALVNNAVTVLRTPLIPERGSHDLCFVFTRRSVDPIWALDWVQLIPAKVGVSGRE